MSSDPFATRGPTPAEVLFAAYIVQLQRGDPVDFEALCLAHPEQSQALREEMREHEAARDVAHRLGRGTLAPEGLPSGARAASVIEDMRSRGAVPQRYRLGPRLGAGGMGFVHEAQDTLLDRMVALKLISDPNRTEDLLPLFRREIRIAAKIRHPGVAGIYDAGVDEQGRVFFAMPLVHGKDLTEIFALARDRRVAWSLARIVGMLRQVCETMAYVHSRGVIHRDLKPANIRVGEFGEVFVMDWGLARDLSDADPKVLSTSSAYDGAGSLAGKAPGTPVYMSPEQALHDATLGPETDQYAIGAMLYEFLAGVPPYSAGSEGSGREEMLARLRGGPPDRLERIQPTAPAELVAICEKAMAREKEQRYPSCRELAEELQAFLDDRVVRAYPRGPWGQAKKWARRNRGAAAGIGAGVLALFMGAAAWVSFQRGTSLRSAEARASYLANLVAAEADGRAGRARFVRADLERCPDALRGIEWSLLHARLDGSLKSLKSHVGAVTRASWGDDGETIVSAGIDGSVRFTSPFDGAELAHRIEGPSPLRALDTNVRAGLLATGGDDGLVHVWTLDGRPHSRPFDSWTATAARGSVQDLAFHPEGRLLAGSWSSGGICIADLVTGSLVERHAQDPPKSLCLQFSSDGDRLYVCEGTSGPDRPCLIRIWAAPNWSEAGLWREADAGRPTAMAVSPDGKWLAVASEDRIVRLWNAVNGTVDGILTRTRDQVLSLAFDPRSIRIAVASRDHGAQIIDLRSRRSISVLSGHEDAVTDVEFEPGGRRLLTASEDGSVRLWSTTESPATLVLRGHEHYVRCLAWSPDGRRIASGGNDNSVRCWDRETGATAWTSFPNTQPIFAMAWAARCGVIVTGGGDASVAAIRDVDGTSLRKWAAFKGDVRAIAIAADGHTAIAASLDGTLQSIDLESDAPPQLLLDRDVEWSAVAALPQGRTVVAGTKSGDLVAVDPVRPEAARTVRAHEHGVTALCFFPDGSRIASGGMDGHIRVWRMPELTLEADLHGHTSQVLTLDIDGTGSRLASAGGDEEVLLWEIRTGVRLVALTGYDDWTAAVSFSPDGTALASAHFDKTVRIWESRVTAGSFERRLLCREEELRLEPMFQDLRWRYGSCDEIGVAVAAMRELSTQDRATLVEMARAGGDNPIYLQALSLNTTLQASRDPEQDARALRWAEKGYQVNPNSPDAKLALAAARLRNAQYDPVLSVLTQPTPADPNGPIGTLKRAVVRGLALVHLNRTVEARGEWGVVEAAALALGDGISKEESALKDEFARALASAESR